MFVNIIILCMVLVQCMDLGSASNLTFTAKFNISNDEKIKITNKSESNFNITGNNLVGNDSIIIDSMIKLMNKDETIKNIDERELIILNENFTNNMNDIFIMSTEWRNPTLETNFFDAFNNKNGVKEYETIKEKKSKDLYTSNYDSEVNEFEYI